MTYSFTHSCGHAYSVNDWQALDTAYVSHGIAYKHCGCNSTICGPTSAADMLHQSIALLGAAEKGPLQNRRRWMAEAGGTMSTLLTLVGDGEIDNPPEIEPLWERFNDTAERLSKSLREGEGGAS